MFCVFIYKKRGEFDMRFKVILGFFVYIFSIINFYKI